VAGPLGGAVESRGNGHRGRVNRWAPAFPLLRLLARYLPQYSTSRALRTLSP